MARARLVTLTTDLGNPYAARLKAVLYRTLPPGHVVDIAHDLPAHGIDEAAFLLSHIGAAFPSGSVHVAVVDPGVGGPRAPIAVRCADGSFLVGPDNGVLWPLGVHLRPVAVVRLDPARVNPGGPVSPTFEGRDLFAPAAALLARGARLASLGSRHSFHRHPLPVPARRGSWTVGRVLHVDHFGNAITNVPTGRFPRVRSWLELRLGTRRRRLVRCRTYVDLPIRGLGILGSSFGTLEVTARESRAADRLGLRVGQALSLRLAPSRADGKYRRP